MTAQVFYTSNKIFAKPFNNFYYEVPDCIYTDIECIRY